MPRARRSRCRREELTESDKFFRAVICDPAAHRRGRRRRYVRSAGTDLYTPWGATPIIRNPFAATVFHGTITDAGGSGAGHDRHCVAGGAERDQDRILAGLFVHRFAPVRDPAALPSAEGWRWWSRVRRAASSDFTAQLIPFSLHLGACWF